MSTAFHMYREREGLSVRDAHGELDDMSTRHLNHIAGTLGDDVGFPYLAFPWAAPHRGRQVTLALAAPVSDPAKPANRYVPPPPLPPAGPALRGLAAEIEARWRLNDGALLERSTGQRWLYARHEFMARALVAQADTPVSHRRVANFLRLKAHSSVSNGAAKHAIFVESGGLAAWRRDRGWEA